MSPTNATIQRSPIAPPVHGGRRSGLVFDRSDWTGPGGVPAFNTTHFDATVRSIEQIVERDVDMEVRSIPDQFQSAVVTFIMRVGTRVASTNVLGP
jgi:hypothetical protein